MYEADKWAELIRRAPPEANQSWNEYQFKRDQKEFKDFEKKFKRSECKYCKKSLNYFNENAPCFHWLLKPKGVKTKHISIVLKKYGYHKSAAYLRWVATADAPLLNINDMKGERADGVVIHETIRYKQMEWTFYCTASDRKGHAGLTNYPHFHLQMLINGRPCFKFSDEHVSFDDYDIYGSTPF
jgi:hypothetical protein